MPVAYADAVEESPPDRRPAGTVRRLVAYLVLDGLVVGVLIFAAVAVVGAVLGPTMRFVDGASIHAVVDDARATLDTLVAAVVAAVYFAGSWTAWARTPGQALLAIRVVRAADGERLHPVRAVVRWLALGAPIALLTPAVPELPGGGAWLTLGGVAWAVVLLLTTLADPRRRGVHDRLAGSRAIR